MGSIAVTALVAFVVVLLALVALRVAQRHGWQVVDRLADLISYGPRSSSSASTPNAMPLSADPVDAELADDHA